MGKREYKLIGCFDESPTLIYKVEPYVYVTIDVDEYEESEYKRRINVIPNWLSPMRMYDMSITFFETSPFDQKAREVISNHEDYINEKIERVKSWGKPDRELIREMANVQKHAEPNKPTYW